MTRVAKVTPLDVIPRLVGGGGIVPIDQTQISDPDRLTACAATSMAMVEHALGNLAVSPESIESDLRVHFGEAGIHDGVVVGDVIWWFQTHGRTVRVVLPFQVESCVLGTTDKPGDLVIPLFHDNVYADPDVNGPYLHYMVIEDEVSWERPFFDCANPWGGRQVTYSVNDVVNATIVAVAIDTPHPGPVNDPLEEMAA